MDELRAHPFFVALPEPSDVFPTCAADLRLYRQDSRQWWACHAGRITTSACAPCLGIYEERAAALLGVPPSLRGRHKALDAHARLQEPPLTEYAALRTFGGRDAADADADADADAAAPRRAVWRPHPEAAKAAHHSLLAYSAPPAAARRTGGGGEFRSVGHIRMTWGSVQEATSLLTALNYCGQRGGTVEEAGLFALEACAADLGRALPAGRRAGLEARHLPLPCLRTAPHLPPWTI